MYPIFSDVWVLESFQTAEGHSRSLVLKALDRPYMISY